mmetsp:Transcript_19377/g.23159  ORF Transcript_19377/g.23159 Transcript_19377/m.23159 type:complete len:258 (-) Transcript_19377:601-1374(-)|eukprot:CAMPEP_0197849234 /NCGR_PEP_ID=MMETSP1438-20131217/11337_1 /TAXON_ID=1461541 /ORGANISM="Pterosperma sp., Strain CCMP1384" /LENGTH=257 /DNA_ID=CAMNT_0043461819 /DNA_START=179 /DNA_END=952 /DNA_ORIENTATION=-
MLSRVFRPGARILSHARSAQVSNAMGTDSRTLSTEVDAGSVEHGHSSSEVYPTPNPEASTNSYSHKATELPRPKPVSRHLLDPVKRAKLHGMLRVDHAGEWGAVRIYEGQLAVLRKTSEKETLEEMADHEREHLRKFKEILPEYRVRPTALLPLWDAMGYSLGVGSALLGKEAAYAVTVAVETVIAEHYNDQLRMLNNEGMQDEVELRKVFRQFRDDEQEHLDIALDNKAQQAPFYQAINAAVQGGCRTAIWLTKRL